jgi:carboxypeptidase C (cathepsin A)
MRSVLALSAFFSAASAAGLRSAPVSGVCSDPAAQEAGYYDAASADKHYFFYSAASRSNPAVDPVVLWLTGGPGCSSLLAAFSENGPCLVPETGPNAGKAVFNPYAWNSNATVVWLDQPAGVGFSYGNTNDKDEADVAVDAYAFLQAYFKAHPALATRPFFVAGESYGGHVRGDGSVVARASRARPSDLRVSFAPLTRAAPLLRSRSTRPPSPTPSRRATRTSRPATSRSTCRACS